MLGKLITEVKVGKFHCLATQMDDYGKGRILVQVEKASIIFTYNRPSDRVRKKMENYAEIFCNIMWKKMTIMRKRQQIMRKFLKIIVVPLAF